MTDIERARELLAGGQYTCVLCRGEDTITDTKAGIAPMMGLIGAGVDVRGYAVADRIVGRAAALLFARRKIGAVLGGIFGVTLMLWICIQFYIFPPNFMSTIYFFFGLAQAATGWAAVVFQRQEEFAAEAHEYPNLETNHTRLVAYFSRMGYVREKALEEANRTGADVYEIRSTERTEGTLGFWWCGRYGMHRWEMPIETPNINLPSYEHVTICAPIWVFALAAPVRTFCRSAKGRIREVDYILVHHTRGLYDNAADEMDALLGLRRTHLTSIRCVTGTYRETRTETK